MNRKSIILLLSILSIGSVSAGESLRELRFSRRPAPAPNDCLATVTVDVTNLATGQSCSLTVLTKSNGNCVTAAKCKASVRVTITGNSTDASACWIPTNGSGRQCAFGTPPTLTSNIDLAAFCPNLGNPNAQENFYLFNSNNVQTGIATVTLGCLAC